MTRLLLQFNMHDFHRGQLLKGKMGSASGSSVIVLLYNTYVSSSIPPPKRICSPLARKWWVEENHSLWFYLPSGLPILAISKLYLFKTDWTKYYFRSHSSRFLVLILKASALFTEHCYEFFKTVNCHAATYSFCVWYLNYFNDFDVTYIQIASDKPSTCKTHVKPWVKTLLLPWAKNLLGLLNLLQFLFKFIIPPPTYNKIVWVFLINSSRCRIGFIKFNSGWKDMELTSPEIPSAKRWNNIYTLCSCLISHINISLVFINFSIVFILQTFYASLIVCKQR